MLTTCLNSRQPDMSVLDCLLVRKKGLSSVSRAERTFRTATLG